MKKVKYKIWMRLRESEYSEWTPVDSLIDVPEFKNRFKAECEAERLYEVHPKWFFEVRPCRS